jgi:hypothetical protein
VCSSDLNIKYLIIGTEEGDIPIVNPFHNGNAWFVKEVRKVKIPTGEFYQVNVFLEKSIGQTSRNIFDLCEDSISKLINKGNSIFSQI